jgi:hypothetical protein
MDKEVIKKLVIEDGLTITSLIDTVIELNGIIGVGLISLGNDLNDYCITKSKTNERTNESISNGN